MTEKICKTCKYHEYEEFTMGFVCVNDDADDCADWTPSNHTCEHWEGKDGKDIEVH